MPEIAPIEAFTRNIFNQATSLEAPPVEAHPVIAELESIQADDLTPKQALDLLYQLQALLSRT